MVALVAFVAVVVLLIAMTGPGYPQSWAQRWGISGR